MSPCGLNLESGVRLLLGTCMNANCFKKYLEKINEVRAQLCVKVTTVSEVFTSTDIHITDTFV